MVVWPSVAVAPSKITSTTTSTVDECLNLISLTPPQPRSGAMFIEPGTHGKNYPALLGAKRSAARKRAKESFVDRDIYKHFVPTALKTRHLTRLRSWPGLI